MSFRWKCDYGLDDCWELTDGGTYKGFIIRDFGEYEEIMGWCPVPHFSGGDVQFPGLSVRQVKKAVEAMIRLEG